MLGRNSIAIFILALSVTSFVKGVTVSATEIVTKQDTLARRFSGVSVRTNLLWDGVAEPNIGLEVPVGDHVSVGANAGLKAWPRWLAWDWNQENDAHWRNFAVVPEVRYYLKEIYQGLFFGADFLYTHYNVGAVKFPFGMYPEVQEERLQGSFWGGGLFVGYAWWPWQHWRLEVEAGAAGGLAAYDRYDCAHCGTKLGEARKPAVVPKLGVNIAYNPVPRDEVRRRREARRVVHSGTDTLTVLTPPVAFVVQLKEVAAPETVGDSLAKTYDWVIPIQQYRPLNYLARPGLDSLQYVQFSVNSSVLEPGLLRNGAVLDELTSAITQIRDDTRTSEMLVSIVGLASIEGSKALNDSLSIRRARAVADELHARTFIRRDYFETIGKGEAWDWLTDQLKAVPEGFDASEVKRLQEILETEKDPDARESLMRREPGIYKKVTDILLIPQRNAGYIRVYYNNAKDPATEKLNGEVMALLKAKRYREAVKAIESDAAVLSRARADAEAMNAYGIAKYFTALDDADAVAEAQALDLLRAASAGGSSCAVENLKGIEVYGPSRKEYEAWKDVMIKN